jgi:Zn-dependent peptidase ImmA (M78 family)
VTFKPRHLNYEQIFQEAELLLDTHNPERTFPVQIDAIVEFDLEMEIVPILGLKDDIRVDAFLSNDLEKVFVDEWVMLHASSRFRFSLAHEVAHFWLHDELYQQSTIQSIADWKAVQLAIGESNYYWFEQQANSFAGLILVPREPLRQAFRATCAKLQNAGVPIARVDHHPTRQFVIEQLADAFRVSEQVMEIRLEKDGLLSTSKHHPN